MMNSSIILSPSRDKSSEIMKAIKNIREVRQQMNDFKNQGGKGDAERS